MPRLSNPLEKLLLFGALTCSLVACSGHSIFASTPSPTATFVPLPTETFTSVPTKAFSPTPISADACWNEWRKTQSSSAFECASDKYGQAVEQYPDNAENHFRWGVLNWESGQSELGREEILNAIELDVQNGEYVEYLYGEVIPPPVNVDIGEELPIYTEQFDVPYFTAANRLVTMFEVMEVHSPKNVALGVSAVRLEWKKPRRSWASFIVGFDENIADRQKALEGGLVSLGGVNRSNLGEYTLTFWAKSEGIQGSEWSPEEADLYLRIKLQDQNLVIWESIGNQIVYDKIQLTEKWKEYTIPFDYFKQDNWVLNNLCPSVPWQCADLDLLYFDWSRVKQINFDIPFYSASGVIYLDEIRIIHRD